MDGSDWRGSKSLLSKIIKIVLKVGVEIPPVEYRSICGSCANDDTLRTQSLSWFARKPWEQEAIQGCLQSILLHIFALAADSESMGLIHTWRNILSYSLKFKRSLALVTKKKKILFLDFGIQVMSEKQEDSDHILTFPRAILQTWSSEIGH